MATCVPDGSTRSSEMPPSISAMPVMSISSTAGTDEELPTSRITRSPSTTVHTDAASGDQLGRVRLCAVSTVFGSSPARPTSREDSPKPPRSTRDTPAMRRVPASSTPMLADTRTSPPSDVHPDNARSPASVTSTTPPASTACSGTRSPGPFVGSSGRSSSESRVHGPGCDSTSGPSSSSSVHGPRTSADDSVHTICAANNPRRVSSRSPRPVNRITRPGPSSWGPISMVASGGSAVVTPGSRRGRGPPRMVCSSSMAASSTPR